MLAVARLSSPGAQSPGAQSPGAQSPGAQRGERSGLSFTCLVIGRISEREKSGLNIVFIMNISVKPCEGLHYVCTPVIPSFSHWGEEYGSVWNHCMSPLMLKLIFHSI